ncbi:hypothetical protein KDA11_00920 [Candidatus Saccharibacteria bacterium]|nr:hypothetical protein [Candidatus Saccharibacteria bacterium]
MPKPKNKKANKLSTLEIDSVFIFKIILFVVLGSQWLHILDTNTNKQYPLPIGAIISVAFAMHDHFKIDRKIDYSIIILAMFVGFWLPMGTTIIR